MNPPLPHVLVNLSDPAIPTEAAEAVLVSLSEERDTGSRFGEIRIALRPGDSPPALDQREQHWKIEGDRGVIEVANLAMAAAARERADLLVLDGAAAPDANSLLALRRALERDPYFTFALPRVAGYGSHLIRKLDPELGDPEFDLIPGAVIDSSPDIYLVPDHLGDCVLIREDAIRDFSPLDGDFETLWGALREFMARARRAGFRCAIANRSLIEQPQWEPPRALNLEGLWRDHEKLSVRFPEIHELDRLWRELPLHERESLLGRAASFNPALRRSLLLELTDMGPIFNGTTEAILGLLDGLQMCARDWQISLLVPPETVQYHQLDCRFPEFAIEWPDPIRRFTAVLRPIQPWSLACLVRLHRLALFNFVLLYDTINDDVFYLAPRGLNEVWRFLARNADGLLYISDFSKERFRTRFPVASWVEECVSRLSVNPNDFRPEFRSPRSGSYLYVVGNQYPHKWMRQTVADLVAAFPFLKLKTLGYEDPWVPQLTGLPSGDVSETDVERLYAEARAIIYPSRYEGFGLPVIRGLSCDKTVIARRSALISELASHYRGPGRLLEYETTEGLVEAVGRVIHGLPVDSLPLGSELGSGENPASWIDVAAGVLDFIEERTRKPDSSNWERRQERIGAMELHAALHSG